MKILIIEDNHIISNNIKKYLENRSNKVVQVFCYKDAMYPIISETFDIIILDLGLGDGDGLDLCKHIRKKEINIPILILTARIQTKEKVIGLSAGADDYMEKPFDYEELYARIQALVRRNDSIKSNIIETHGFTINENERSLMKGNNNIKLSKLEFNLFLYLVKNKGKVLTKNNILERVWGESDDFKETRAVDMYISYLRKKIGKKIIETRHGQGYIIH